MSKKALILGITGQDGSYLSELLLDKGYEVHGVIRRSSYPNTQRIDKLFDPEAKGFLHYGDLATGIDDLLLELKPDEVYNLAAMSHVKISFDIPVYTLDINAVGPCRVLEGIRKAGLKDKTKFYQASSSEMFGIEPPLQNEDSTFRPVSPYGVAKLAAYHLTRAYRNGYSIFACNGILFNHETNTPETPVLIRKNGLLHVVELSEISPSVGQMSDCSGLEIWDNGDWTKVKYISRYKERKPIKRLLSRSGYVECTYGHKVCVGGIGKEIERLNVGDKIDQVVLPQKSGGSSELLSKAWVAGFFVGDGCLRGERGKSYRLDFFNKNTEYLKNVELNIKLIDSNAKFIYSPYESSYKPGSFNTKLRVKSDIMRSILKECYIHKKPKSIKRIPQWVFNSSIDVIESFLDGYCAADGTKSLPNTKYKFQYYTTISQVLAAGIKLLCHWTGRHVTYNCERRENPTKVAYYHKGFIRSRRLDQCNGQLGKSGFNLMKDDTEITKIWDDVAEEFVTITTESGKYSAGTGFIRIFNSPRRGVNFVTRKITRLACKIKLGIIDKIELGNLDAKRDWGFSGDYVDAIYRIMQFDRPDDFVVSTGETHTVQEFADEVFSYLDLNLKDHLIANDTYRRPNEVPALCGDSTKARTLLGWEPKVGFQELVKMMVDSDLAEEMRNQT